MPPLHIIFTGSLQGRIDLQGFLVSYTGFGFAVFNEFYYMGVYNFNEKIILITITYANGNFTGKLKKFFPKLSN